MVHSVRYLREQISEQIAQHKRNRQGFVPTLTIENVRGAEIGARIFILP